MLLILENYPKIKATFNLVPSLIDQIEDYQGAGSKDIILKSPARRLLS
jgi:alpha-amylase/alpha-mannosidase (GH57 family)